MAQKIFYLETANFEDKKNVVFKAKVVDTKQGPGYKHIWGYNGGKPLAKFGDEVFVEKWVCQVQGHDNTYGRKDIEASVYWLPSEETLYRCYTDRRCCFQLTEEEAQRCLRAVRRNGKLLPLSEQEAKRFADARDHVDWELGR